MILFVLILIFALFGLGIVWERRHQRQRRLALLQQLRTWAGQTTALDAELQAWIHDLSEEEANILLELLTGYCASLNWELTWLFAPHIDKAPILKQTLETHVVAYAQAILASLQIEEDVRVYQAYLAFVSKSAAHEQRRLAQKLYSRLCEAGLIARATPPQGRFFRRQSEHKQQVAALQQAFAQEPEQTMALLQQTLSEETATLQRHKITTPASTTRTPIPTVA
ncbi:MAG: hypothetical protein U0350_47405 [Caldilineaceae bacterium]